MAPANMPAKPKSEGVREGPPACISTAFIRDIRRSPEFALSHPGRLSKGWYISRTCSLWVRTTKAHLCYRYQTLQPINEVERFARGECPASCPTPRFCGASARLSARSMAIASSGWSYSGRELVEMRMGFRLRHRRVTRGLDRSRHLALPSVAHARLDPIYPSCQRINYRK